MRSYRTVLSELENKKRKKTISQHMFFGATRLYRRVCSRIVLKWLRSLSLQSGQKVRRSDSLFVTMNYFSQLPVSQMLTKTGCWCLADFGFLICSKLLFLCKLVGNLFSSAAFFTNSNSNQFLLPFISICVAHLTLWSTMLNTFKVFGRHLFPP